MAEVQIRPVRPEDAAGTLKILAVVAAERIYIRPEPQEVRSVEEQQQVLAAIHPQDTGWYVAEVNGEVVGQITAHRGTRARTRHNASIGISVLPKWRGEGVGSRLMQVAEAWARAVGVERLVLEVYVTNERARHVYEKAGYVVEGLHKGSAKVGDEYWDEYSMAKWLK